MNLLIVSRGVRPISSDLAGGAEFVLLNHARSLARLGHSVHMVSDSEGLAPEDNPYTLHKIGTPLWFGNFCRRAGFSLWIILHLLGNMLAAWSALRVIRNSREPFDVIHCHGNLSGLLISLFHRSTPIVYTEHDSTPWTCYYPSLAERILRKTVYNLFNVRLYRRAVTIAVLYPEQKAELEQRWGISPEKIVVVANGVNEQLFSPYLNVLEGPHPSLPPLRQGKGLYPLSRRNGGELERGQIPVSATHELPETDFCLFVGRLEPRKGVDVLIRALRECSISCVIVGDGPERKRLEALAAELGIDSRVTFVGKVLNGDLKQYYCDSSFYTAPSFSEAFPLTALEAMACGKAVIASRVGGLPSLLDANECGLLCEVGDVEDLAQKIQSLERAPELSERLGRNARDIVLREYTWDIIADRLVDLYQTLTAEGVEEEAAALAD